METLQTPYGNFTVYLNHLNPSEGNQFHVSFVDNKNKLHVVLMQEKDNMWIFVDPDKHPDWIIALQNQLDMLITREQLREYAPVAMAS